MSASKRIPVAKLYLEVVFYDDVPYKGDIVAHIDNLVNLVDDVGVTKAEFHILKDQVIDLTKEF